MRRQVIYSFLFLTFLVAIVSGIYYYNNNVKPTVKTVAKPMEVAFQNANAAFVETKLQGWAKINDLFLTKEELLNNSLKVEKILGLNDDVIREATSEQGFNSFKVIGHIYEKNIKVEVIFQSLMDTKNKNETYLIINMVDSKGPDFFDMTKEILGSAFQVFNQEPEINQLIIGFQDGKLTKKTYDDTINSIFSAVGGKISGEVEEENYFSMTGYVPNIKDKLKIGRDDVNIQVAMAYDELENKTYIYIGSPLVYSDY